MKRKPKYYISGKVTGDPSFREKFAKAERAVRLMGFRPVNPVKGEKDGKPWNWYLRRDLKKLADCDGLFFLPDWKESRGARLEKTVAERLGLDVMPLNWIELAE